MPHIVLQRLVIRIVIVRVQRQHRTGQLVHNVLGGCLDDHVFREIFGQLPVFKQQPADPVILGPGGQVAEDQQPHHLLKTKPVLLFAATDDVLHIDAPVSQLALVGDLVAVGDQVAVDVAHMGQPRHHAGAICVAQAALHTVALILFFGDHIVLPVFFAQLLNGGAAGRFVVQPFHVPSPFSSS